MSFIQEFSDVELEKIKSEFTRLEGETYLDHVGTTLYGESQIKRISENLQKHLYCNPHTSPLTKTTIDQVRFRILQHFNADPDEYEVIFTSNATASLRLVGESFSFSENDEDFGTFYHCVSNHTSVLGMRSIVNTKNIQGLTKEELLEMASKDPLKNREYPKNSLVTFSAQCNFNGYKFPLDIIDKLHKNGLSDDANFYVCLDAASFVSTNFLHLGLYHPDFVCFSFYKMLGYPTGLGALLVSKRGAKVLRNKKFYGGGTVQIVLASEKNFHVKRDNIVGRFEDGTIPFLSIIALSKSFEFIDEMIPLNSEANLMARVSKHVFNLAKYVYDSMKAMKHYNGTLAVKLYHDSDFSDRSRQGGVVNFNIRRSDGSFVGFSEFGNLALLHKITLRTGCFCNAGACQIHCQIDDDELLSYFKRGRVCGMDDLDLADGKPTGSVRIAFGYMSTKENADFFLKFVQDCYVESKAPPKEIFLNGNGKILEKPKLKAIHIYPVKSCAAMKIKTRWPLSEKGLKYDREFMIIKSDGSSLTQKNETKLCLIQPVIDLEKNIMTLEFPSRDKIEISLSVENSALKSANICNSKICGDKIQGLDCGDEVAEWLSDALCSDGLRLIRQCGDVRKMENENGNSPQISLANQAQFLIINEESVRWLTEKVSDWEETDFNNEDDFQKIVDRFRGNLILENVKAMTENTWKSLTINGIDFKYESPCYRCQMVCIDQHSGIKTKEPLRTIGKLSKGKMSFGIYVFQEDFQENQFLTVGDSLTFKL